MDTNTSFKVTMEQKPAPSLRYTRVLEKPTKKKLNKELRWLYDLLGWEWDDRRTR